MYDTQKRVALAKERIAEYRRRQARRSIRSLSVLCALLFFCLLYTSDAADEEDSVDLGGPRLIKKKRKKEKK